MDYISEMLIELASCLCEQIKKDGSPETCFCGVINGEAAVQDYGGSCSGRSGSAWVRLITLYPASGVNVQNETIGNCSSGLGAAIEIGISRAVPVMDPQGNPPTQEALLAATVQQMKDALTMHKAISCCSALTSKDYILGTYAPFGPLGAVGGGTWGVAVGF